MNSAYENIIFNEEVMEGVCKIQDQSVDLIVADPPYGLRKDYGNDSDCKQAKEYLEWSERWLLAVLPKLKQTGSLYIFLSWRESPEVFSFLKTQLIMLNEIIWDRRVPSMGGSTRRYSSVHDTIGFFARSKHYYFDLDAVRIPYDQETKKARSRSLFEGAKWLELGYNPKDVWSIARLHRQHAERVDHPTQKPIAILERMIKASSPPSGLVLDPFMGSGSTAVAALQNNRRFVGFELNSNYCTLANERIARVLHR